MRLGMIGSGGIAAKHLTALDESQADVEVVAYLSVSPQTAEALAARHGGTVFDTIEAFLKDGRPDVVFVTVPPDQHGPIERTLVDAGIPFLIEKPIGIDAATPLAIAETIARSGLVTAVGYNWRALDVLAEVRPLLAETPLRMITGRFHVGTPATPWWRFEAVSGGQMVEQACHLVDLSRHLAGEGRLLGAVGSYGRLPEYDTGDVAGASAALFALGGVPVTISATCVLPHGPGAELRLICENREIAITLSGVDIIENGEVQRIGSKISSYTLQNRAFLDAVRQSAPDRVLCSYADAMKTHELVLAAAEQIRQWR